MKKIVFATHNLHKLHEVQMILKDKAEVIGLQDIGCNEEIPETAFTLQENALLKAKYVFDNYHYDCIADDTGLEISALDGKPGIFSARYAGEPSDSAKNVAKVLNDMEGKTNREAQFRTVIAFVENGNSHFFEGIIKGKIGFERTGENGFGYDPIFFPDGYDLSFAEMDSTLKNKISHRAIAIQKFTDFFGK